MKIKNQHSNKQKLKFNGIDAYVKSLNPIDLKTPTSIFISFKPDELTCDVNQYSDDFNIFTIPGYDFSIAYNSYSRYNICLFDKNNKALFVNSKITKDYYTNIIITIDEKNQEIKVYQDGEILETIKDFGELYDYTTQEYLYLGMGNPLSDSGFKYFKGLFDKLVVFEGILNEDEIKRLIKNEFNVDHNKILWYDADKIENYKLNDLSDYGNHGEIINCEIVEDKIEKYKEVKIPYRRDSIFKCLPHEENGFVNNAWKDQSIRWNQIRFYNEVCKNDDLIYNEGLSTLDFAEHEILTDEENIKHITVGV